MQAKRAASRRRAKAHSRSEAEASWLRGTRWVWLSLLASCSTTQTAPVEEPRAGSVKVVEADEADREFQQEMDALKDAVKSGKVDWEDVADRMDRLTDRHSGHALSWYNKGVAYEKLGRIDEAEEAYRRAVERAPKLREAQENLAGIAVRRGNHQEAVSILRELVARDPGAAQARVVLASHQLAQGDIEEAERLVKDALTHQPTHVGAYCVLAQIAVKQKNVPRVRLLAAQAFKIDPEAPCLHYTLGLVALREKDLALALTEFERAVAKDPNLAEARFRIAEISLGFKDFKKAIDNYSAVARLHPKDVAALVNLGIAYKGSGQFDQAEATYKRAIDASDNGAVGEAYYNLGVLYLRNMNRIDEAEQALKRHLQISDDDREPVFAMLEEITKLRQMAEEEKRMEEEARRQEAAEEKMRATEAARAKEEPPEPEPEGAREPAPKAPAEGSEAPAEPTDPS